MFLQDKSAIEIAEKIVAQRNKFPGTEVPIEPRDIGLMASCLVDMKETLWVCADSGSPRAKQCIEKWSKKPTKHSVVSPDSLLRTTKEGSSSSDKE
jgi:hypothetical protein